MSFAFRATRPNAGGQAVIEGVMMRSGGGIAVAVRRPSGSIAVRARRWPSITRRVRILGLPLIRGVAILIESLSAGLDALRYSAQVASGEGEDDKDSRVGGAAANIAVVAGLLLAVVIFKAVPHGIAYLTGLDATQVAFHLVDAGAKLALVCGYILAISRMKDIQRVFQYHGAEHKSIRAYEEGASLDVENARGKSRLHERCGTSFIVVVVLASMLVYIALIPALPTTQTRGLLFQVLLVGAKLLLLAPVAAIAYELNRLASRFSGSLVSRVVAWPGIAMQRLTTREPSDDQIEVAMVALQTALEGDAAGGVEARWREVEYGSFADFRGGHERERRGAGADPKEAA